MTTGEPTAAGAGGVTVYVGLGSNEGDRRVHLRDAVAALARLPDLRVTAVSPIFETQYVGPGEQAPYLNACLELRTTLPPDALLARLQALEAAHGRPPESHLRPRPLDCDILVYGDRVSDDPRLTLPHPRLSERAFVLEPLRAIAPRLRLPLSGETVAAACARIAASGGPWVRRWGELEPAEGEG